MTPKPKPDSGTAEPGDADIIDEKVSAATRNKAMESKTVVGYTVKAGEEKDVHVKLFKPEFDTATGKAKFAPFVSKYAPTSWIQFLAYRHGFVIVEVLHLPKGCAVPEPDAIWKGATS